MAGGVAAPAIEPGLHGLRLLVRPDTVLRWHRDLVARRHAAASRPRRRGRPPTVRSIDLDTVPPFAGRSIAGGRFIETVTLAGTRMCILAVIEHASRRIRILGATEHPTAAWVNQAARNMVMDLEDAGCRVKYLIRDRESKYPRLFDEVLADAGIEVVLAGVRLPRMNAIMERWVRPAAAN